MEVPTPGYGAEPTRKICESTRSTEPEPPFGLAKSREKRVPKIKNMYGVTYKPVHKSRNPHKHGNDPSTKSPTRSILVNFLAFSDACKLKLISQIFVCLAVLMVSANVWAVPIFTLSAVDTDGDDSVFNGSTQKLRITIGLTGTDEDPHGPYIYTLTVNGTTITGAPEHQITINQTKTHDWDGGNLSDGAYIIRLEVTEIEDLFFHLEAPFVTEVTVTLDKTAPEISIGTETAEFSPNGDRILDRLDVFYGINEGLKESKLEFFLKTGESKTLFGQSVNLNTSEGGHRYVWDGGDRESKVFPDGQYVLKIRALDKAGNTAERETIPITIDTKAPLISQVAANENLTLVDGVFINVPIQLIKVTADAAGGTPLDFAANQTELTVKKRNGGTIVGDLSYDAAALTLSFGNRLDTGSENGEYTASIVVADRAGNATKKTVNFTFDNVSPDLTEVATSNGKLAPGSGVSTSMNFVEATLSDNLQDGLSLSNSTIRLTGPNGAVLGRQTQPAANKIRWIFLSPLSAKDGLMDGEYTIEVVAIDKAGNQTGTLQIPFLYDNLPPLATLGFDEASPFPLNQDTIYHAQPLSQIVATFDDAGVGVDLDGDTRVVFGTTDAGGQINALPGRKLLAKERNLLTYILETPLANRDGSQDGRYVLNVQTTDTLGNTTTYNYHFVYDTQLPTLVSTTPAANATISELSQVEVVLDETTSGIDFIQSTFQLTRDVNGNLVEVPVNITSNGTDRATLTLAEPIALDGSDDGTYTIEITPTDLAGNLGTTVRREFYLITQSQPEIRLTMPETTTVNNLTTVVAELSGYIGAGIDLNASTLTVRNAQGSLITSTELEHDEVNNLLTWNIEAPLPRDRSADGEYTVTATFVDFTGRRLTQQFQLLLDTQFPLIESVQVTTESQPELSTDTTTTVAEGFSQIILTFENTQEGAVSGIDFINTGIALTNPAGENIVVNRTDNGQSSLTLDFQTQTQLGEYVLSISPQDLAGNQSAAPLVYQLRVDVPLPTVTSVLIGGKLGTIVYVNGDATNIVATFADLSGAGLDLGDGGSTITVTTESGLPTPGITTSNGTDQLTWTPTVLPINGSADGQYTVVVTPKDKAGRQGDAVYRQFVYDTQEPRITAATPVSLIQPVTYISGSLTQLQFTVEDVGPAGLELSEQTIELLDAQGAAISATLTFDELNSQLYLTLDAPLAQDGSADGEYTLKLPLVDRSGNVSDSEHVLVYDSQVPRISSVSVNTESPVELLPQEIAEVSESISSITLQFEEATGIDFTNTNVTLTNPAGESISANQLDDGEKVLTLDFPALTQRGEYVLSISPQDLAGNQSAAPLVYRLRVDVPLPTVTSVLIGGKLGTIVYVNGDATNIVATFADLSGAGLDLGDGGSTITVTTESGLPTPGITTSNGTDQLTWTPTVLPINGSADGQYTVVVTPKDKAGRQGDAVYRQFVYDTQEPRITAATPVSLIQPATYIGSLTQLQFTVEDVGPAGLELSEQTIELLDPQGATVNATFTVDEINSHLYLTLDAPLAQDGSADGEYTLKLPLVDRSGNVSDSEHVLVYDSQVPRISSVSVNTESPVELLPQEIAEVSESISSITLQFEEATGIDFTNTNVTLTNPAGESISANQLDDGEKVLTLDFPALTQRGEYVLSVTPQDLAGNQSAAPLVYRLRVDVPLPTVTSVLIGGKLGTIVYVNGDATNIVATFADLSGAGLDLGDGGSTITVTTESGLPTPGITTSNGTDQLTWTPTVLPINGSADGQYTVVVTPKDKAGRQGDAVYRQFVYDTQEPRITAATPVSLIQPATYIGSLTQLQFTVEDVGPAGLELAEQTIELLDPQGATVNATFTVDEINSHLYLTLDAPLTQDGSVDGTYTVKVSLADKAGNILDSEQTFVYDSQVPRLTSVSVNTESSTELVPQEITEISESISSITLQFEEATRVDFTNTAVDLVGPNGQPIPINISADGSTQLTARFVELTQTGLYTLSVTPQDIVGNVAQGAVQYSFRLVLVLPSVSSVELGGQTGDVVFLNGSDSTIVATLVDATGTGLDLGEGGSSIVVTNPTGSVIPSQTRANGTNQLIWQPISLPTDGSADGRYTVAITPIDKAGRQGNVVYREFIYDTESPRITASSPIVLSQPVSYIPGGLNQFSFTIEDVGPADLLLEAQTIELIDSSGSAVPATLTYDELTNQLYLTLPAPFARDGSVDGAYTVKLSIIDRAGNTLDLEHLLIYDSQVPQLSSVTVNTEAPVKLLPQEVTEIVEPVSSITLQFDEATRVDFANTVITLLNTDATDASGELTTVEIPLTLEDDGTSQMTVSFPELNQIGTYTLSVTPQDRVGNVATGAFNYTFILDIPLPSVSSVIIGDTETGTSGDITYVNASNMIIGAELLDPTETGLSFRSDGSDITVTTLDGTTVPGTIGSNGENLLLWQPKTLTTDGTTDGRYRVYVFPVDKAGRQGSTAYREFIYDTQEPEITQAGPIDLTQPVSYISQSLTQFHFTVADVGPAELELSDQKVTLRDASGNLVPAQLTNDTNSQLFLTLDQPLPLDGSMDGEYTVAVELTDKAGNAFSVEHQIVYDTQAPTLVSTVPADGSFLTEDITQIQVTLNDEGDSGIDWTTTTVTLVNPSGQQISGELVSNGTTALTLSTNQLVEDGRYIIQVRAVDRAGNGNATLFERSFLLSRRLPAIVSTEPVTASPDEAFTNEEIEQIEVELETDDENHLSTLRLLNPENQVVAGQQQRASGRLIYNLVRPLATDGSDDGLYTIEFTPISASGRSGEVQRLTFTYDTQAPEIESDDVINLVVSQPGVNNSLIEIRVNLTDDTSGIDWENLDEEWLTFERLSPNAAEISGRVDDDEQGNLTFRLAVPLADNGSADGEYRITLTPKDRAGNDDEPYEKVFIYDTSPPMIDTGTLLINDAPLLIDINANDYPTAISTTGGVVIQANIFDTGLGVNLAQSKIIVRRPDGSEVSGNTQQNGVDTILFKSDGLSLQGSYQVTVMSVGNDSELLGFAPTDSITTEFLYETDEPTAAVTSDGGETELTDEPLPLEGTASDPAGTQRIGDSEIPVPASGVWLVEIVGTGPDDQPIDPVPAVDDSNAQEELWSRWSLDFLPTRSGEYDLDVRVTDNAGNYAVYDIGKYTMSVSLTFRGSTFGWPNPLRLSQRDVAFFSFDVNVPLGETIELTLSIYDWSGDMVLSQTYPDVVSGQRNDQLVKWNLENQAGTPVARGLYIFRLEAVNAAGNRANTVGKVLVVD